MSTTEEATINSDGTTTFENADAPPLNDTAGDEGTDGAGFEETVTEVAKGIDPAFLFLGVVVVIAALYYYFVIRKKKEQDQDDFFANLDGEKVRDLCGLRGTRVSRQGSRIRMLPAQWCPARSSFHAVS
jgi:hypothetical protein